MSTLDRALRKTLADTIIEAREVAEEAARDAVRRLGVIEDEPPTYLSTEQKALRVRLRAHARSLGDGWNSEKKKLLSTRHLETEAAYEIWHRMLFGRFLVERGLLIHPDLGEPIAPSELADLAREEGEADPWSLVERFAAPSLPAVFKPNDPVLAMTLDPALAHRLRTLVTGLPTEVFKADDALGWTYQFWRTSEKEIVNKAGGKVGPDELPAVTQLFTERYMVQFLLHNTLGAWWAGKYLAANPEFALEASDEQALRDACALPGIAWEYLRFVRDSDRSPWRPAAGSFPGWPDTAAKITYCDPCCGSGHFLVEALLILAAMRQYEEGLSGAAAARAVLRDNIHGLELDGRCVQIAAFNVAITAWKVAGSPISLPQPQIAWIGAPPPLSRSEMAALGGDDTTLRGALEHLYNQFTQAPLLGSLLEIGARDLLDIDLRERGGVALAKLREREPEQAEGAVAAQGLLDAANLLSRRYVLLATNVPFLGYREMSAELSTWLRTHYPDTKGDLGYCLWARCLKNVHPGGTVAVVSLQHWLSTISYKDFRKSLLTESTLGLIAYLGSGAFETITGEKVNVTLSITQADRPSDKSVTAIIDAGSLREIAWKQSELVKGDFTPVRQATQLANPAHTILFHERKVSQSIGDVALCLAGIMNGDTPRFTAYFWEIPAPFIRWVYLQSTVEGESFRGGFSKIIYYDEREGHLRELASIRREKLHNSDERGNQVWGKAGIAVNQMADLHVNAYYGNKYDSNVAVIVPHESTDLPALLAFCSSEEFSKEVRKIERKMNITNATFGRVPIDLDHWRSVATQASIDGLPDPFSNDPTQWHFHGNPAYAENGTQLHVALARVAGYRWPAETDTRMRLSDLARERLALAAKLPGADEDGLLPLHTGGTDRALADRLRAILEAAYGAPLTPEQEADLVRASDAKFDRRETRDGTLETWLRDRAFRQHCVLFQQRPFLWQVWDGLRDGFSAFLNYHRLSHATLEKLTFTLLGDWIAKARAEDRTAHEERARQLQQKLRAILDGDAPYDIFVRWKPFSEQPFGWHPDLDDGVRINIRPFMTAEVLREQPRVNWARDRGTDVPYAPWFHLGSLYGGKEGDRINDHHLTLAEKRVAQSEAKAS